jgi:thiamine biosynthesis lipoprotein
VDRVPRQLRQLPELIRRAAALALATALGACAGEPATPAPAAPVVVSDGRYAMGTVLEITVAAADEAAGRAAIAQAFSVAAAQERLLSNWDAGSALARLNAAAGRGPQRVDPELARVLAASLALSRRTRGAFDVTVGPLVALWRDAGERGRLPTAAERARAQAAVGVGAVRADPAAGSAEIARAGASIELGGIAKGWALDRMAEGLRAAGVSGALLSFGQSSLWAIGTPPGEPGWRLLVRDPAGGFAGVATLRDRAVSVSGSVGQWTEIEGRRYGHVIDPRSGEPLVRAAQAVVLAPDAASAEAFSKALLVLPAAEGVALLEAEPGCDALLLEGDGRRYETSGWQSASRFEPAAAGARAEPAAREAGAGAGEPEGSATRSSERSAPASNEASR